MMYASPSRRAIELTLPGVVIGLGTGVIAGGLAVTAGLPLGYILLTTLGLGIPLAAFGAGYDALLAKGRVRLGGVLPVALYWLPLFPLARLTHEIMLDLGMGREVALSEPLPAFLAYNAILSVGYAIGFLWLHENLAAVWWPRVRNHNPVAARYVGQYVKQAVAMEHRKGDKGE